MQNLTFTIITVCYNSGKTIERALQSVANQDWSNVEHVVIDGGSTDNTIEIINNFLPRVTRFVSEPDDGIYDAMNKGLNIASGDVVAFLNADDFYSDSSVLSSIANLFQRDAFQAIMGDVGYFKEGNVGRIIRRYRSSIFTPKKLRQGIMPAHPAFFIHRDILTRVGGFNPSYKIAGDFELVVRIFKRQNIKLGYLPKVLVNMQMGGISTSGWRAKLLINREILRACKENGIKTNIFLVSLRYLKKITELNIFN